MPPGTPDPLLTLICGPAAPVVGVAVTCGGLVGVSTGPVVLVGAAGCVGVSAGAVVLVGAAGCVGVSTGAEVLVGAAGCVGVSVATAASVGVLVAAGGEVGVLVLGASVGVSTAPPMLISELVPPTGTGMASGFDADGRF